MPEPGPRGTFIGSPDTSAERPSLIVGQTTEASGALGAAWVHPTYGGTDGFAYRTTGEAPFPVSGRVELYDPLTLSLTSTPEIPFAVSGQMTPGEIFPVRIDAYAASLREDPLPISGRVEFYDTINVTANLTEEPENPFPVSGQVHPGEVFPVRVDAYATALREDPVPISGRVELYDTPVQVRLYETATAEYTRESPVPVSGSVTPGEVFPVRLDAYASALREDPVPVSGRLELYDPVTLSSTGEAPLPVSGRVELYDLPIPTQSRLYETATTEYTRESPVPVSGMVGLYEVPPVTTTYSESTFLPVSGAIVGAANSPLIFQIELQASGTEYSQVLPSPLYGFDVQASGTYDVRMAFVAGQSDAASGKFLTVKSGQSYGKEFMNAKTGLTMYFASDFNDIVADPLGGEVPRGVQIVTWTE